MASVTKRGKTWQYTVSRMVDGKSKPIRKGGFRTKKDAQVAAAEIESGLSKGIAPVTKSTSFAEYFHDWINLYKKNKHITTYERYLNSYETVKKYFGDKPIQSINKAAYQLFLNNYAETHAKFTTKKLNTHIRACVKDAVDEGLIRVDFTRKSEFSGSNPTKRPEEKHLHLHESEKLLNALYNRLDNKKLVNYLLLLALVTGMRFGELVGLTRSDFNFDEGTLRINKTWDYKNGTGFGPTKGDGASDRIIDLDETILGAFKNLFENTPSHFRGLVFHSDKSKYGVLTNEGANKVLKAILTDLKIDLISVHDLRHTHTSILLYSGATVLYVSERLGHANPQITMEVYSHIIKELRERDAELTKEVFSSMRKVSV
ncbi:Putative prophage phiRv2 integrase [Planococcus massiliensis]|uniref:Putative prophage phiRv2 integrase n=1 Tax=Planococcus massiliensis TaxID=1499687 RepID=A0A098ELH4_9BACL|nr:site-specific integrase [Planococcus massiliensis]CEG23169.1 Putative prophage phiRv2 integrase [Planococcus massiliensis]